MSTLELVPETGDELPSQQIARRIRGLMAEHQITGTRMAEVIGLDQRAFSRRYRGVTPWSIDELSMLARALKMPFEDLVRHEGLEPPTRWLTVVQPDGHVEQRREQLHDEELAEVLALAAYRGGTPAVLLEAVN